MDPSDEAADTPSVRTTKLDRRSVLAMAGTTTIVGLAGCSSLTSTPGGESDGPGVELDGYRGDGFTGILTQGIESTQPADIETGVYEGEITYDESCDPVGDGLTGCDAGIELAEVGTVNFYYEHDMDKRPCLVPDEHVAVEVQSEETIVQRRR